MTKTMLEESKSNSQDSTMIDHLNAKVSEMSEAINGLGETNQSLMESNTGLKDELDTTKVMLEQSKANLATENASFIEIEQLKAELVSLSEAKSGLEQRSSEEGT